MAQLLRCFAMLGSCAECCQMLSCCFHCCSNQNNKSSCLISSLIIIILGICGMCFRFSLYYSNIGHSDLITADCQKLCGNGYITYNDFSCCMENDVQNCQIKEDCQQRVLKQSENWLTAALVISGVILFVIVILILKKCIEKCPNNRIKLKDSSQKKTAQSLLVEPSLDRFKINSSIMQPSQSCYICLQSFKKGKKTIKLKCKHSFHYSCMDQYLKSNFKCPICHQLLK